jgi:hypothetical protein
MGRLVRKPQVPDLVSQAAALKPAEFGTAVPVAVKAEPGDGYLERMVKYVPAEIIAFSMIINAILEQAMKSGGGHAAMAGVPVPVIATVALIVACLLTPLFCWYVRCPDICPNYERGHGASVHRRWHWSARPNANWILREGRLPALSPLGGSVRRSSRLRRDGLPAFIPAEPQKLGNSATASQPPRRSAIAKAGRSARYATEFALPRYHL